MNQKKTKKAHQLSLFSYYSTKEVVNVASVKHRSPFRYPGGKTWLVPKIRKWLASLEFIPTEFIEPFAGGAIVSLTVAFDDLAGHIVLAEIDKKVGSVWQAIIEEGEGQWLAHEIENFVLTKDNVENLLSRKDLPIREKALQTIVHNRVSRGGILAKGAGLINYGENGKGIMSRWYPQTLAQRIKDIEAIRAKLTFRWGDGFEVIEQRLDDPYALFFIDPPYTAGKGKRAGRRLYEYSKIDHERLFALMNQVAGDFLMTYDNDEDVRRIAERHGFDTKSIAMKNTHHAEMTELLIGRDLNWLLY